MRQSCLKMLIRLCPRAPVVNSSDLLAAIFFSLFFGPTQAQPPTSSSVAELPGPSPALHAAPFHTCVRNFYVATVCLDLGGPKDTVTPNSGVIVKTAGLNTARVASRIAAELTDLIASPTRLAALSAGGMSRATEFLLHNRVAQFYREAWKFIEDRGGNSSPVAAHSCAGMPMRRTSCNRCLT